MPDKLTDSEIIKALECCIGDTDGKDCVSCPLYAIDECQDELNLAALDLINRQEAEIESLIKLNKLESEIDVRNYKAEHERLEKALRQTLTDIREAKVLVANDIKTAKAEAYKEFAERLKETFPEIDWLRSTQRISEDIDNILKEMIGE